jgi:competence protein ComEC
VEETIFDIWVFWVGFGDCIHITLPNDKHILLDTGRSNSIGRVIKKIKKLNKRIDYLILTHDHSDHIGGVNKIIESDLKNEIKCVVYWLNYNKTPGPSSSNMIKGIYNNLITNKISISDLFHFDLKKEGLDDYLKVLYPVKSATYHGDMNRNSIILSINIETLNFLLMGDATKVEESFLISSKEPRLTETHFIKIGHHGSAGSSSSIFLNEIKNKLNHIAVSCKDTRYTKPPCEDKLKEIQSYSKDPILFTGEPGVNQDINLKINKDSTGKIESVVIKEDVDP